MTKNYIESNILEYQGIKTIYGYNVEIIGETDETYYKKEFRYSNDKILWSDYKELTNKNLSKVTIYDNIIYIQYKFTKIGNGELSVENISLDIDYLKDDFGIPECHWLNRSNQNVPQIIFEQNNGNLFNPYNVGNSYSFYNQMSTLVSNIFGFCVLYFKTEPNAKSRDVVLKEYSIEHVIDKENIKILIPDNQFPTKELQFNTMMIDYPVQFEVHIVKSEFWRIFGDGSHPDPHDYLYMQKYMNKMYMVDSVSEPDDFGYQGTYWRVSLVPYQELSSVKFEDNNLLEETESLIFSAEGKFENEINDEIDDIRKDNQLNDIGDWQEGQDFLRRGLDPNIKIREEKIYNEWTVVSKQFYDLSTIEKDLVANEYKYTEGFNSEDERMISFIFRPNNTEKNISGNILIDKISKTKDGFVKLKLKNWNSNISKGNLVKLFRVSGIDKEVRIIDSKKSCLTVDLDFKYNDNIKLLSCAKLISYEYNDMFNIKNETDTLLSIAQTSNNIILNICKNKYFYSFEGFEGFENKWYAVILGIKRGLSNVWLYEFDGSEKKENVRSKIVKIGVCSNNICNFDFGNNCYYDIISCNVCFTNFRLWNKLCEEDKHNLILSQYVIDDTHNTLIVDNAQNELLLNNKWS